MSPRQAGQSSLTVIPLTLEVANDCVARWHRHHKPVVGHRFSLGVLDETGTLRGALCAGRPVARMLDQDLILEVNRLATDGCPNACSALYGAARKVAKAMGYNQIITYILDTEPGTSLIAAGWIQVKTRTGGGGVELSEARKKRCASAWIQAVVGRLVMLLTLVARKEK